MPKQTPRNSNRMQFKNNKLVSTYLKAKEERDNRLWNLVGGKLLTFFRGEWMAANEFEQHFPILKQSSLLTNLLFLNCIRLELRGVCFGMDGDCIFVKFYSRRNARIVDCGSWLTIWGNYNDEKDTWITTKIKLNF